MAILKSKIQLFIAGIALASSAYGNDVYIEQIGDDTSITIIQDGTSNRLGDSSTPAYVAGQTNTVTTTQTGSGNELDLLVNGTATTVTVDTTGDGNQQAITCGSSTSSSCSSATITQTVVGDNNIVTQTFSDGANHTSNIIITGDSNVVTHSSDSTAASGADISVTGGTALDPNNVTVTQSGSTPQYVKIDTTGNGNNISITQSN